MSDYKSPKVTKDMILRLAIFSYIAWFEEHKKDAGYVEVEKSINKIVEGIISLLKKGDN